MSAFWLAWHQESSLHPVPSSKAPLGLAAELWELLPPFLLGELWEVKGALWNVLFTVVVAFVVQKSQGTSEPRAFY